MDYGHQHYLDILQNQKYIVVRALERLERRTAEVLYKQQKWFKWVRDRQNEEEEQRDDESKRIKREAALFKRHWKEMEVRMKQVRAKEEAQRQEEYLDRMYNERKFQADDATDSEWDPIEEAIKNNRGNFVGLIKYFLWQDVAPCSDMKPSDVTSKPEGGEEAPAGGSTAAAKAAKGSKNKKKAKAEDTQAIEEPKGTAETKEEMHRRLQEGSTIQHGRGPPTLVLTRAIEFPVELDKTPLPEEEIDILLEEISEIKHLLLCRQLLSHSTLLPAALKANSVEGFLMIKRSLRLTCEIFARRWKSQTYRIYTMLVPISLEARKKIKPTTQKRMRNDRLDPKRKESLKYHSERSPAYSPRHGSQSEKNNCRSRKRQSRLWGRKKNKGCSSILGSLTMKEIMRERRCGSRYVVARSGTTVARGPSLMRASFTLVSLRRTATFSTRSNYADTGRVL